MDYMFRQIQKLARIDRERLRTIIECSVPDRIKHTGYVYWGIGTIYNGTNVDKIGRTYNIDQRSRQHALQTFSGGFLLGHTISCYHEKVVEKAVHYFFMPYRFKKTRMPELFILPQDEVRWLCSLKQLDGDQIIQQTISYLSSQTGRFIGLWRDGTLRMVDAVDHQDAQQCFRECYGPPQSVRKVYLSQEQLDEWTWHRYLKPDEEGQLEEGQLSLSAQNWLRRIFDHDATC